MDWNDVWIPVNIQTGILGLLIFTVLVWFLRRPKKLPPGPWSWPLLGALPQLAMIEGPAYKTLTKMGQRFGPVFSFNIFNQLVVVLQDYDVIKTALDQNALSGRPSFEISQLTMPGKGVLSASGEPWLELRKFSSTVLRKLGMGKSTFEQQIATEATYLLEEVRKQGDESFDPRNVIENAVANVICYLVFGNRFEYTDERFRRLIDAINKSLENGGVAGVVEFLPIISKLTFLPVVKRHIDNNLAFQRMMGDLLRDHEEGYQRGISRDFTDAFRNAMAEKEHTGEQTYLTPNNLFYSVSELFGAGMETTTSTLRWALLYMIAYPETQTRVQQEMDRVVGRNRLPRYTDRPSLPYTQAVLCEVQRELIVPYALPHKCTEDTTLSGYHIPEGAIILINLWHILHDADEWEDPMQFRPERFLDSEGRLLRREKFIPFGLGRRVCLGKHLAKMELFIVFTSLLHQFTFKPPEGVVASLDANDGGITHAPVAYTLIAAPRD
ncbi:cytochrome P450 2U1-like [Patiria miniata]|uniref:Cytochrome P450 n=1 Tax=Patiria miniata TaxID=46514 RepID=A0A913ZQ82_PATMI|nr:cytochrome P450 2U1-like [Patiria miniata]